MPPFRPERGRTDKPRANRPPMRRKKQPRSLSFDYKEIEPMRQFINQRGKIMPRRKTGLSAKQQRQLGVMIKRARHLALLPYEIQ